MKGSIETAAIAIGGTLAPIVSDVAKVITELVNKFLLCLRLLKKL